MERHKAIIANNILERIVKTEEMVKYINSIEGEFLRIRTIDCPYEIPVSTIHLRDDIYKLIKKHYEDELNNLNDKLSKL